MQLFTTAQTPQGFWSDYAPSFLRIFKDLYRLIRRKRILIGIRKLNAESLIRECALQKQMIQYVDYIREVQISYSDQSRNKNLKQPWVKVLCRHLFVINALFSDYKHQHQQCCHIYFFLKLIEHTFQHSSMLKILKTFRGTPVQLLYLYPVSQSHANNLIHLGMQFNKV